MNKVVFIFFLLVTYACTSKPTKLTISQLNHSEKIILTNMVNQHSKNIRRKPSSISQRNNDFFILEN